MRGRGLKLVDDDINFRSGNAAAHDFAHFEARAEIQRGGCFLEMGEGNAGVNESAEQHVAADSGKAFEISNTHRE